MNCSAAETDIHISDPFLLGLTVRERAEGESVD